MTYIETIKNGFRLINKNWQLIIVQIILLIISTLSFFIVVGIPFAIAFILFGIDLTRLTDFKHILDILGSGKEFLSKYIGLLLIVVGSLFLYFVLIGLMNIYIFAGSVGVIGRSLINKNEKFSIHTFFSEAKRLFTRMLGFTFIIGLVMIFTAFFLGILGGSLGALISFTRSIESKIVIFILIFLSLLIILLALFFVIGILSFTLYGIASLLFKDTGPIKSIKESIKYLSKRPDAFWLYAIIFGSYLLISFILIILKYPIAFIPIIGTILSFPLQLISAIFEAYLGLAFIAIILSYYYSTEIQPLTAVDASPTKNAVDKNSA